MLSCRSLRITARPLMMAMLLGTAAPAVADPAGPPLAYARLGETVRVDGPRVRPLAMREDSRCPGDVTCAWAGRVRVSVQVQTGRGARTMELTLGQPVHVADGMLELASVTPDRRHDTRIAPGRYRFGFRFAGGL